MHLVASRLSPGGLFSGILKHFCNTCHQECTFTLCVQKFIVLLWILSKQTLGKKLIIVPKMCPELTGWCSSLSRIKVHFC